MSWTRRSVCSHEEVSRHEATCSGRARRLWTHRAGRRPRPSHGPSAVQYLVEKERYKERKALEIKLRLRRALAAQVPLPRVHGDGQTTDDASKEMRLRGSFSGWPVTSKNREMR